MSDIKFCLSEIMNYLNFFYCHCSYPVFISKFIGWHKYSNLLAKDDRDMCLLSDQLFLHLVTDKNLLHLSDT